MSFLAGPQSALDPAGIQSQRIAELWWLNFWICLAVYLAVVGALAVILVRKRRQRATAAAPDVSPAAERRVGRVVGGAVLVSLILLFTLIGLDFTSRRGLRDLDRVPPITIAVVGHQWWWEFQYQDTLPSNLVSTATELHLPAGRVVRFVMRSGDVIHSFWIPNLTGKKDLFPGRLTTLIARADRPGTYVGQCAEFCGHQHATMRFLVVVEPEARFQSWLASQRQPAAPPATPSEQRGQAVFLTSTCAACHSIQGTKALARVGPDLTHLASRHRIAGAYLPNTPAHLSGWIADPQRYRPGVLMPANALSPQDASALVDYLKSLR
jgi:cytochrome c oxidase subunit 2